MKVSRAWLQTYFEQELPSVEVIADALTFHAFEIEGIEGEVLDVKVLPDRAAYGLSHRGIASEISAILNIPLAKDPLKESLPEFPSTEALKIHVEDSLRCPRYMGAVVKGVKVGPSPEWLKSALESVGQRSINNVVDATNYVMLDIGQPLHAFDAAQLSALSLGVRSAKSEETMTILSGEQMNLPAGALIIVDGGSGTPVGIAGIKGGKAAGISDATTDIVVESANFEGTSVRKSAQALKLFTDASSRFQNRISPELAAYGMRDVLALIVKVAGGTVEGVVDVYPHKATVNSVPVSIAFLSRKLGLTVSREDVESVFNRLSLPFVPDGEGYLVTAPFYRRDIERPEDLVEEVGRVLGYDRVPSTPLPEVSRAPDQRRYRGLERIKDFLIERGFTELSTPSFGAEGDILLANPLQADRPWLRPSLLNNMKDALARAVITAPRVLGPVSSVRLFELGTVFTKDREHLSLSLGYAPLSGKRAAVLREVVAELATLLGREIAADGDVVEISLASVDLETLGDGYALSVPSYEKFRPFSAYPFALRDIAVWTTAETSQSAVEVIIIKEAGELLARIDLFDRFEKDGKISYAFRLVFESFEKTLADTDIDPVMAKITAALNAQPGWSVR